MKNFGFLAKFAHLDQDGSVLWATDWIHNALLNEGEQNVLQTYLQNQSAPSSFRVRLFADTPVETDSLSSLTGEPGGLVGYAPQTVNRDATANGWPTLADDGGDYQAESKQVTFNATGTYPAVTYAVLATSSDNSGKLIDATPLSQSRQLKSGQSLQIVYKVKMS